MTTVEKLFVQIFERKNSIIQQVKQQTDLYGQHLASKLLIDGISPPPWIWNLNHSLDVQKVLNKEELISEILLTHPRPAVHFSSAHCSLYNKSVVAGDSDGLLIGLSKDIYSYNKGDTGDRQDIAVSHDNNTRCTVDPVPELDFSVYSPLDESEARISNIYTAPDQSLARIQRSRSRQKALELRCSGKAEVKSHSSQKNVSVGSSARSRWSIFGSEKVNKLNDSQEIVDPCVTRYENYGVDESNKGYNRNEENCTRLKSYAEEASSGVGFLKLDSCCGSIQKNDSIPVQYEEEFAKCANSVNELPEAISASGVNAESCGDGWAEDCLGQKEKGMKTYDGRISQPSSSQHHCLNESAEAGISIHSAEADRGIFSHFMQQFDNANHCEEITKPSDGLAVERVKSETTLNEEVLPIVSYTSTLGDQRDKTAHSSSTEKSLKVSEVHRTSSGKAIVPSPFACNINNQQSNNEGVSGKEFISHDLVKDPLVNCRSNTDHAGSECLVYRSSCDCLIFLEPKQLDFDESEECNPDNCFGLNLENRRLQNSPKNTFVTLSDPLVTSDNLNNAMPRKLSSVEPEISTEADELCRDSFESTSEEHANMQFKECNSHINEHPMLETTQEDSEIVLHIQNSNSQHQIEIIQSNALERSDTEDHLKCYSKEVCESPPKLQTHEGQYRTDGKVKSTSASNASKRKHLVLDYGMGENEVVSCGFFESPLVNHPNLDLSKPEELKFGSKFHLFKMGSWPRTKSRKTEEQETALCSAPSSYSVGMHYSSQSDNKSIDLEKVGHDVQTVLEDASQMNESTNEELKQKVAFALNEEMKPLAKPQNRESASCSGALNKHLGLSSSSDLPQVAVPIFSILAKEAARVPQECLVQEQETLADSEKDNDGPDKVQGHILNTEGLSCTEKTIIEGKSYLAVDDQLPNHLEQSPYKGNLDLMRVDQSLPELEGFIIDLQTETEEVEISGNHINFDELDLPRTSIERASILEKICKSASQQALSTQFSSSFKLHVSHKPYRSVPNGLLECIDLKRIAALNKDVEEQYRSDCMDDVNGSFRVPLYTDSLPYSGSQFGWDSQNPYGSPVGGKLCERISLHTSSSAKTLSSNPELTCFPIEEDPSVSEENENVGEVSDNIQEDVSSVSTLAKRQPLADITGACLNAPSPAPMADKFLSKGSGSSATKEANFSDSHTRAKRKIGNHSREKSLDKENGILSFGGNAIKKSEASLNSRFSKVNSSCKTSSKKERKKLSEKEPKHNNIVSNVTSFIPLVLQKQAATQCTGKRDIKVKALEAAEAAKRLEEKKENERKMRKEALKIERARLEQENLRQMELEKKRKEEERKKKDADILAKKRQREEEGKKEKERKRRRLEEARQQQREDRKLRLEKVEKAKQLLVIGDNDINKKEACNESKRSQVLLKESRDNIPLEKPQTKLRPNGFTRHVQNAGISIEACHASTDSGGHRKQAMTAFNKSPKTNISTVQKIQEKSYEISPYQCSDDEEEEEEDIPDNKFIPSWASKSCVALVLPLQQGVNPDAIFPPDSFCSTDEVLHP